MNDKLKELYLTELLKYLENVKREIEADGMIATLDEAIGRLKITIAHELPPEVINEQEQNEQN
jgi:hypothetical protein